MAGRIAFAELVAVLEYAAAHERAVRIVADDGTTLEAVPVAVDPGRDALEAVVEVGPEGEETVISLTRVAAAELI